MTFSQVVVIHTEPHLVYGDQIADLTAMVEHEHDLGGLVAGVALRQLRPHDGYRHLLGVDGVLRIEDRACGNRRDAGYRHLVVTSKGVAVFGSKDIEAAWEGTVLNPRCRIHQNGDFYVFRATIKFPTIGREIAIRVSLPLPLSIIIPGAPGAD